jgi:hypothetical protein|tara:strand:+ start:133 stop:426 length:294 start_codon:yes stop_codon:yes gene_type:complete
VGKKKVSPESRDDGRFMHSEKTVVVLWWTYVVVRRAACTPYRASNVGVWIWESPNARTIVSSNNSIIKTTLSMPYSICDRFDGAADEFIITLVSCPV